jgi:hypothetical protein
VAPPQHSIGLTKAPRRTQCVRGGSQACRSASLTSIQGYHSCCGSMSRRTQPRRRLFTCSIRRRRRAFVVRPTRLWEVRSHDDRTVLRRLRHAVGRGRRFLHAVRVCPRFVVGRWPWGARRLGRLRCNGDGRRGSRPDADSLHRGSGRVRRPIVSVLPVPAEGGGRRRGVLVLPRHASLGLLVRKPRVRRQRLRNSSRPSGDDCSRGARRSACGRCRPADPNPSGPFRGQRRAIRAAADGAADSNRAEIRLIRCEAGRSW